MMAACVPDDRRNSPIYILVPEESVFMARFLEMEERLLHSLYYYHLETLAPHAADIVRGAYESWGEIQEKMPPLACWQELSNPAGVCRGAARAGYKLYGPDGNRLVSLHAVQVGTEHIRRLEACRDLLDETADGPGGPLAQALEEISEHDENAVHHFRRTVDVMRFPVPSLLLAPLRRAAPAGPVLEIDLNEAQQAAYLSYSDRVALTLSSGDDFAYAMHRALYT
ncbi:hypothetical protein [uncultured Streptomyces sp.]|uniref:hypothetical protein n=1 Tax=uncultured Streptomyces sp. TaxID=174707 RepID=UPI002620B452|nr:hypothetical protein [uncultured Streptomyces sp.]